jgi:hypothetical protein
LIFEPRALAVLTWPANDDDAGFPRQLNKAEVPVEEPAGGGRFKVREEPFALQNSVKVQLVTLNNVHRVVFYNVPNVALKFS